MKKPKTDKKSLSDIMVESVGRPGVFNRPDIQAYIETMVGPALARIEQIGIRGRSESVKFQANKDIVDRAIGKPIEYKAVSLKAEVLINLD